MALGRPIDCGDCKKAGRKGKYKRDRSAPKGVERWVCETCGKVQQWERKKGK